jgi:hypothetical protein
MNLRNTGVTAAEVLVGEEIQVDAPAAEAVVQLLQNDLAERLTDARWTGAGPVIGFC